jgi:hypothetical protein
MGQHHWKPHDDLVAFYLYRYGTGVVSLDDVERKLGIPAAAMKMRNGELQGAGRRWRFGKRGLQDARVASGSSRPCYRLRQDQSRGRDPVFGRDTGSGFREAQE